MAWLTKSRFLSGLQCHKRLWFEIHEPIEAPVEPGIAILQGRVFDEMVQQLHPGIVVSRDAGMPAAIAETAKILAKGAKAPSTLYQPAFRAGDLAIIADVIRRHGAKFELIEIKASTAVKDTHIPDAAFQALVLQRAKIPVGRVFIGHVNNQFVLQRPGNYDGILVEADVTDAVQAYLQEAADKAIKYREIMRAASAPVVAVGPHCLDPYECPFLARCTAREPPAPEFPVDLLPRGGKIVEALIAEGFRDLRDVPAKRLTNEMHQRVYEATRSGLAFFDRAATAPLRKLLRPYSFLDFETISFSVPEVIGTRPYEQLPFQWSMHVEYAPSDVRHAQYLAIESFGDFDAMVHALIAALPSEGPIFAYNASFEARVLNLLADHVTPEADTLRAFAARLIDLLPVTREAYYHRDMRGSWSIKSVAPTISAELGYEHLNEVQEGDGAQLAFLELRNPTVTPDRAAGLRSALLRYCAHDTWVMVVLRRFLCGELPNSADTS
jgi:hypothetical protein